MSSQISTILLTRPKAQADRFAGLCNEVFGGDLHIIISPLLKIEILQMPKPLKPYGGFIFTSENGVQAYVQNWPKSGLPAYCVGPRTEIAAKSAGFQTITANGSASDLIEMLKRENVKNPLLHIHGEQTRGEVVQNLQASGYRVDGLVAYHQIPMRLNQGAIAALSGEKPLILPLFSPRTAELFFDSAKQINAKLLIIALSKAIRDAVPVNSSTKVSIAKTPDANAMLKLIKKCLEI